MISDCSLFTMIPGFCTPVVQTRASPPAGLRTARRPYLGRLSTRRPTVHPSVRNHLGRSRQTLQSAPGPIKTLRPQQMSEHYRSSVSDSDCLIFPFLLTRSPRSFNNISEHYVLHRRDLGSARKDNYHGLSFGNLEKLEPTT